MAIHTFIEEDCKRNFAFLGTHSHRHMNHDELLVVSPAHSWAVSALSLRLDAATIARFNRWYTFTEVKAGDTTERAVSIACSIDVITSMDRMMVFDPRAMEAEHREQSLIGWLRKTYCWG